MPESLIKSAKRVREFGEVFTPDFLIAQMLDQFPPDAWESDKCWLEPTCGNGQFILAILRRKITANLKHMRPFMSLMRALDTTFGTDIMDDNISDCRMRIYTEIVIPHWDSYNVHGDRRFNERWQVACVVSNNIRRTKDALKEDYNKFQHFADIKQKKRDKHKSNVEDLFALIDSGQPAISRSDKRLHSELSVLMRNK